MNRPLISPLSIDSKKMKSKFLQRRGFLLILTAFLIFLLKYSFSSEDIKVVVEADDFVKTDLDKQLVGDTTIYTISRKNDESKPKLVFLSILNDHTSYGNDRTFDDYISMIIKQTNYEMRPSIGLLISDENESKAILSKLTLEFDNYPFERVMIIHQPNEPTSSREDRKQDHLQKDRRRMLSILRNKLSFYAVGNNDHLIWIDTDISSIPEGLSMRMIKSKKDVVVPSCYREGTDFDYDLNSWVGKRTHPNPHEIEIIKQGGLYVPRHDGAQFIYQLKSQNKEFVELDSVGGTMMYMKADLYRQGVIFPPFYVVGTDWDRKEGWDGIETEGVCYIMKTMGYKCWAMPFEVIRHVNN